MGMANAMHTSNRIYQSLFGRTLGSLAVPKQTSSPRYFHKAEGGWEGMHEGEPESRGRSEGADTQLTGCAAHA